MANRKMKNMAKMLSMENRKTIENNAKKLRMATRKMKNKGKKLTKRQDEKKHSVLFLPHEILLEILSWLTVESLLRCKCVCKQWYAIIQDHKFVEMHMTRNKGIFHYSKREGETLDLDGVEETFVYLHTCDGLLLEKSIYDKYHIRNPSTKQILVLPDPHVNSMYCFIYFHSSTGTYRVMSIHRGRYESSIGDCEVLDLGASDLSWRSLNISQYHDLNRFKNKILFLLIADMVYCFRFSWIGLLWIGSSNPEIFSLDLEKEEVCTSVPVPRSFFSDWRDVEFISWGGKPSLVCLVEEKLNVWVLDDYKRQKWADSKILISMPFLQQNAKVKVLFPWISQGGQVCFLLNNGDTYVYHIESKLLQKFPEAISYNSVANKATLVTLKGMQPEKKESKK